jgi:8-oxo-dGTP diphosphatase
MRELRQLHEVVAGERLMPDSFRRLMERQLEDTGRTKEDVVGRPVALQRRKSSRSDS